MLWLDKIEWFIDKFIDCLGKAEFAIAYAQMVLTLLFMILFIYGFIPSLFF